MGLTLNCVALLAAILGSTLVASQSASPPASASASPSARRYPNQNVDYEYEYEYVEDETTSCVNYCRSRLMGVNYCCQPPSGVPADTDGHLLDCTSPHVDCQDRPRPVTTRPRVIYPRRPPIVDCVAPRCDPTRVHVPVQTVIHNPGPVRNKPVLVYEPRPVVYNVPALRYTPRRRFFNGRTVVYDTPPHYACDQPRCSPVQPRGPTTVIYNPGCVGPRCDPRPRLPVACRVCDRDAEDLVSAVHQLVLRSYARAYTMQTFIVGLRAIIGRHWEYSWYGECVAAEVPEYEESSEEVPIYEDQIITTTAEECHPCPARPTGVRRCRTRFQTILGSCDNSCCLTSRSRTRRDVETVVADRQDLREEVARLLGQAHTLGRRAFLTDLEAIVQNAANGRYRWNQTVDAEARTPSHVESLPPTTTVQPSSGSVSQDKSNSDDYIIKTLLSGRSERP